METDRDEYRYDGNDFDDDVGQTLGEQQGSHETGKPWHSMTVEEARLANAVTQSLTFQTALRSISNVSISTHLRLQMNASDSLTGPLFRML